ncbi:hypothetical protein JOY44_29085 [Phormidium sp. CLA17]|nr:hypothetical protein [Leptolyngbya sp. Cla-17]MBM0745479.1 hypothetical protein [Leptolyngbya sp. Cla-17]
MAYPLTAHAGDCIMTTFVALDFETADRVWLRRRIDSARHWYEHHQP